MNNTQIKLWNFLQPRLPRILGQLERDFDSPAFGSFDRNYWHYKIRDFSSIIVQQGLIIVNELLSLDINGNPLYQNKTAEKWVEGGLKFWAGSQLKSGAFNEYYPFESGYPPTAFSLYTVGLILRNRNATVDPVVIKAINKAIKWLLKHPEKEAYNQEAAGLAGMVLCADIPGVQIDRNKLDKRLKDFYNGQSPEGWFPEYHGPDTGYLSVTIDCLYDIYESSNDKRALKAAVKAIEYISHMVSVSGETPVMINSRNTDYIVLYGLSRMSQKSRLSTEIVYKLLDNIEKPDFYLNRTDDRYASHYVYQSCFRSLRHLRETGNLKFEIGCEKGEEVYLEEAGIKVVHKPGEYSLFVNMKKGGIVNIFNKSGIDQVDYGYRVKYPKRKVAVTHWLDQNYLVTQMDKDNYIVNGIMSKHGWMKSSPIRHISLRILSYFLGNRLIPLLKKAMIFGNPSVDIAFERNIHFGKDEISIEDDFKGKELKGKKLYRAPHYSLRHVSSAGQFVPEELLPVDLSEIKETHIKRTIKLK